MRPTYLRIGYLILHCDELDLHTLVASFGVFDFMLCGLDIGL